MRSGAHFLTKNPNQLAQNIDGQCHLYSAHRELQLNYRFTQNPVSQQIARHGESHFEARSVLP